MLMVDWCLYDFLNFEYFPSYFFLDYVKGIKTLSWGGGQKCGAFLSSLDRDPHPSCTRCKGKVCTRDKTCDFCVGWSSAQWEQFVKKRSYTERKRSRPSGSVPPAPQISPRARTSSGAMQPGTSSSSSSSSLGMHLVLRPVRLPLLLLDLGPARGVEVSAPILDPPVFPDLRIVEQGRIAEFALGRPALVVIPVVLALTLLTARGQAVESVGGGPRLGRCPPASGRAVIGRSLRTAPGLVAFAFNMIGRCLRTATDRVDSVRDPLLVEEVTVTVRGHATPFSTSGHMHGLLPLLTAHNQRREDDKPDVRCRSVWRQLLSPRLLLSLRCLLQWLLLLGSYCSSASVCCAGSRQVFSKHGGILFPWSGWRCCGRGCSCIGSGGSAVPSGSQWRSSHILCCDCGSCWRGWSSCCFLCCTQLVRPSVASGGLPL